MNDLPVCRLCKCAPQNSKGVIGSLLVNCRNSGCNMYGTLLLEDEWRKLMYVPERKPRAFYERDEDHYWYGHDMGYNQAIDDLEKGGV